MFDANTENCTGNLPGVRLYSPEYYYNQQDYCRTGSHTTIDTDIIQRIVLDCIHMEVTASARSEMPSCRFLLCNQSKRKLQYPP